MTIPLDLDALRSAARQAFPTSLMDSALSMLLVNSMAEGMSNCASDIDVMLLISADAHPGESAEYALTGTLMDRACGLHILHEPLLRERLADTTSRFDRAPLREFLHRVRTAVPVSGEDRWQELTADYDWNAFDRVLAESHLATLPLMAEDIAGNVAAGDAVSAVFNARALLACALDALLDTQGGSHPRPKWRYRQAVRALGSDHGALAEYVALHLGEVPLELDELTNRWLPRCLAFARGVAMTIHFPSAARVLVPFSTGLGRTARWILADRDRGRMTAQRAEGPVELDDSTALVWYLCDHARDTADLTTLYEAIRNIDGGPALPPMNDSTLDEVLSWLESRSLAATRSLRHAGVPGDPIPVL